MEKKTYYIAVGSGEILEAEHVVGNYEFEIEATEEEIVQLENLFEDLNEDTQATMYRAHIPYRLYHHDNDNDWYDLHLVEIYRKLHELGTEETKQHIESMGIMNDELIGKDFDVNGNKETHV